jgi:hypothetical protein
MRKWFPLSASELFGITGCASLVFTIFKELGSSGRWAAVIAILIFVAISILWGIARLWQYEGNRFQLTMEKRGTEALTQITNSTELILVTHLGTLVPSEIYIAHMLEKLNQGIPVIRIVGDNAYNDEKTKIWLEKFRNHERYSEYFVSSLFLPFDFAIYDGHIVILYLPTNAEGTEFNQALIFRNPKIALIFRGIFEHLIKKGKPTSFVKATPSA